MNLNYELEGIKAVFMDLDGTLYLGNNPIAGVNAVTNISDWFKSS